MKSFQKNGKWIEKPSKTVVLTCVCGSHYIRTRGEKQHSCIKCMTKVAVI